MNLENIYILNYNIEQNAAQTHTQPRWCINTEPESPVSIVSTEIHKTQHTHTHNIYAIDTIIIREIATTTSPATACSRLPEQQQQHTHTHRDDSRAVELPRERLTTPNLTSSAFQLLHERPTETSESDIDSTQLANVCVCIIFFVIFVSFFVVHLISRSFESVFCPHTHTIR